MVNSMHRYITEADQAFNLFMKKADAVSEASRRELEVNRDSAELKVMQENGTDYDLMYLYEEAEASFKERAKAVMEKIKQAIIKFFSEIKDRILTLLNKKENQDTINKIEKKVKIFPLLGKKKVMIENFDKQEKCAEKHISMLRRIKAKVKTGHRVDPDEISDVKDSFVKEHAKLLGIGAAVTMTVAAAIVYLKKLGESLKTQTKQREQDARAECEEGISDILQLEESQTIESAVRAMTSIIQTVESDHVRCVTDGWNSIKRAMSSFGKTDVEINKSLLKNESADQMDSSSSSSSDDKSDTDMSSDMTDDTSSSSKSSNNNNYTEVGDMDYGFSNGYNNSYYGEEEDDVMIGNPYADEPDDVDGVDPMADVIDNDDDYDDCYNGYPCDDDDDYETDSCNREYCRDSCQREYCGEGYQEDAYDNYDDDSYNGYNESVDYQNYDDYDEYAESYNDSYDDGYNGYYESADDQSYDDNYDDGYATESVFDSLMSEIDNLYY